MKSITIATLSAMVLAGSASAIEINVPGDYSTIDGAIAAINPDDAYTRITIDAGTYTESNTLGFYFQGDLYGNVIEIIGATDEKGQPAVTLLDTGDLNEATMRFDNAYGGTISIQNIILADGQGSYGGALRLEQSWGFEFRNCVFRDNYATSWGGGVWIDAGGGGSLSQSCRFVDCSFVDNMANGSGGAVVIYNTEVALIEFQNCTISNNDSLSDGGGLYISDSRVSIENSAVTGCTAESGGGLFVTDGNPTQLLELTNSIISGNTANSGGGMACGSAGTYLGGEFSGNTALYGAGVWVDSHLATLTGATVRDNSALANGGGVYVAYGVEEYPDVIASTVCGNTPNQVWHIDGDASNIINTSCESNPAACCVNGACIMVEPLMCDDVGGTLMSGGEEDCSSTECAEPCLGDVNNDSEININDLLTVIANWGGCP